MKSKKAPKQKKAEGGPIKGQGLVPDTNFAGKDAQGFPIDKYGRRLTDIEQMGGNRPLGAIRTTTDLNANNKLRLSFDSPLLGSAGTTGTSTPNIIAPSTQNLGARTFLSNDINGNVTYKDNVTGQTYTLDKQGNKLANGGKVKKGYAGGSWVNSMGQPLSADEMNYSDADKTLSGYTQSGTQGGSKGMSNAQANAAAGAIGQGLNAYNAKNVDTDMKYGSNAYFDDKNKTISQGSGLGQAAGSIPVIGGFVSAIGGAAKGVTGAVAPKDAYGVSDKDDANVALAGFLKPSDGYVQAFGDIKNGKFDKHTLGNIFLPGYGAVTTNNENREQRDKLKLDNANALASETSINDAFRKRELSGGLAMGGMVTGKGGPKDDKINAKVKEGSFVVPVETKNIVLKKAPQLRKKADLNQTGGEEVRLSNGEILLDPLQAKMMDAKIKQEGINILAPNAKENNNFADGGRLKGESQQDYVARMKAEKAKPVTKTTKKAPKSTMSFTPRTGEGEETIVPGQTNTFNYGDPTKGEGSMKGVYNLTDSSANSAAVDTPSAAIPKGNKLPSFDFGSALEYGASAAQIGLGLSQLNKSKRPIYTMDKTFESNVDKAQAQAQFGYTPEQQFMLDQQNQGLTNSGLYGARNYSGGSAANALSMERSVLNDANARAMQTVISGQQLMQSKQARADALLADKMAIQRQIFNDSLGAFQQKTSSASALANTGLKNLIGASRVQRELDAQEKANNLSNSWMSGI